MCIDHLPVQRQGERFGGAGMKIALAQSPNATCFPAGPLISELYSPSLRIDIISMGAVILETVVHVRIFSESIIEASNWLSR